MIQMGHDILLFATSAGSMIPCSVESIAIELQSRGESPVDTDTLQSVVAAVVHYFKRDLKREAITLEEFLDTLQTVFRGIGFEVKYSAPPAKVSLKAEYDLDELIDPRSELIELALYPVLREGLRSRLRRNPEVLYVRGLRKLVRHVAGTRRWSAGCQRLSDRLIRYMRQCLAAEAGASSCPMVVE
jgi:hypothetical protein